MNDNKCPCCKEFDIQKPQLITRNQHEYLQINCTHCGRFNISEELFQDIDSFTQSTPNSRSILSHYLRRRSTNKSDDFILLFSNIKDIIEQNKLPLVAEQADYTILYLGETCLPGEFTIMSWEEHGAVIGSRSREGFNFIINSLSNSKYIEWEQAYRIHSNRNSSNNISSSPTGRIGLTFEGWNLYEKLSKGKLSTNKAFMAMKFGDENLDSIFTKIQAAVNRTGFALRRLDSEPQAGLIDNRLRVEIQTSRFLIADLTHNNNGAYWEAGYAEGLGKPVIYTCEKSHFSSTGTHFDTNHHLTIIWDNSQIDTAMEQLKATIRATFPDSKMED